MNNSRGRTPGRDEGDPGRRKNNNNNNNNNPANGRHDGSIGEAPKYRNMTLRTRRCPNNPKKVAKRRSAGEPSPSIRGAMHRELTPPTDHIGTPQITVQSTPQHQNASVSGLASVPMQRGRAQYVPRTRQASPPAAMTSTAGPPSLSEDHAGFFPSGPNPTDQWTSLDVHADRGMTRTLPDRPEHLVNPDPVWHPHSLSPSSRPDSSGVFPGQGIDNITYCPPDTQEEIHQARLPNNPFSRPGNRLAGPGHDMATPQANRLEDQDESVVSMRRSKNPFSHSNSGPPSPFSVVSIRRPNNPFSHSNSGPPTPFGVPNLHNQKN
ncbi:hypothetical protein N0V93_004293 [Gnomoniopsis smithogilvyi]|uniref:Uncharacterized protein n=1 Tax=Gnomoniopsis smithogilvyi TaxID=1191159 RepID=A0A9W9CWY7_9PEZI|nr:hypothetical protein N0V93_004293 [Gnomoniopsis smithogilvyi]